MLFKIIPKEELASLLRDSYKLHCLENTGVDNWDFYDAALSSSDVYGDMPYVDYSDLSNDDITINYDDIKITNNVGDFI